MKKSISLLVARPFCFKASQRGTKKKKNRKEDWTLSKRIQIHTHTHKKKKEHLQKSEWWGEDVLPSTKIKKKKEHAHS